MSDLFLDKGIKPMLIGVEQDAFDSPDYLYELKLDGERCIAYLDTTGTDLRNKRNIKMLPKVWAAFFLICNAVVFAESFMLYWKNQYFCHKSVC